MSDAASSRIVLLTGATGFVGTHAAHHLIRQGYRVRCLVRPTSDRSRLPEGIELAEGHLLNYGSLQKAVKGCWGVMHVGGVVRVKETRDFYRINRDGTSNIVRAAREAGAKRFLLCSSQAASGPSTPDRRRRADDPSEPVTEYGKSKLAGEEALKSAAGEMWWCIVRPPAVYGPWDTAFLTLALWIKRGIKLRLGEGRMPFAIIHVVDLARAMQMALEASQPSGATWYATDSADHTMRELMGYFEHEIGRRAIWLTIPLWAAPFVASSVDMVAKLSGTIPFLGRQKLAEFIQPAWTCDDEPFRKATGFSEMYDLASGIADTVEWYFQNGWL
jgi:nucleoside-diphosphate-sugar epimerase